VQADVFIYPALREIDQAGFVSVPSGIGEGAAVRLEIAGEDVACDGTGDAEPGRRFWNLHGWAVFSGRKQEGTFDVRSRKHLVVYFSARVLAPPLSERGMIGAVSASASGHPRLRRHRNVMASMFQCRHMALSLGKVAPVWSAV